MHRPQIKDTAGQHHSWAGPRRTRTATPGRGSTAIVGAESATGIIAPFAHSGRVPRNRKSLTRDCDSRALLRRTVLRILSRTFIRMQFSHSCAIKLCAGTLFRILLCARALRSPPRAPCSPPRAPRSRIYRAPPTPKKARSPSRSCRPLRHSFPLCKAISVEIAVLSALRGRSAPLPPAHGTFAPRALRKNCTGREKKTRCQH